MTLISHSGKSWAFEEGRLSLSTFIVKRCVSWKYKGKHFGFCNRFQLICFMFKCIDTEPIIINIVFINILCIYNNEYKSFCDFIVSGFFTYCRICKLRPSSHT